MPSACDGARSLAQRRGDRACRNIKALDCDLEARDALVTGHGGRIAGPNRVKESNQFGAQEPGSDAEIKAAYHALAKVWHPDKHASAGAAALETADRTFKLVARAYQVLSDAKTRNRFDRGENVDAK